MANRIDAPLDAPQPTAADPTLNRTPSHPQLQKLPTSDDAVLSLGKLTNPVVYWTSRGFYIYVMGNPRLVTHHADRGGRRRAGGALNGEKVERKRGSSPPVPPLALIP